MVSRIAAKRLTSATARNVMAAACQPEAVGLQTRPRSILSEPTADQTMGVKPPYPSGR
jgi:hypothetical protein